MLLEDAISDVYEEISAATQKYPEWPNDPLHAVAILGEEFGELQKAVLQLCYEPHKSSPEHIKDEAIQTAAMAIRFICSLEKYQYAVSQQHEQDEV